MGMPSIHADGKSMYHNGNYCGADRVFNVAKGKFVKPDIQDIVSKAATYGVTPFLMSGKKLIMLFICPNCNGHHMIKLIKKPDYRNKIHACKDCGYRYLSPGFIKNNGTFQLV
jgi:predicted RNA-binding Zn-ribbon protein involved in translation (DUF1610 family)